MTKMPLVSNPHLMYSQLPFTLWHLPWYSLSSLHNYIIRRAFVMKSQNARLMGAKGAVCGM